MKYVHHNSGLVVNVREIPITETHETCGGDTVHCHRGINLETDGGQEAIRERPDSDEVLLVATRYGQVPVVKIKIT